jgi:3-oxoadipate enol-lactonase
MPVPTVASVDTPNGPVSYAQQGEGPPIVLLHSLLTDRQAFDRVTVDLPGRVIAIDLPGFGGTALTGPSIGEYAALMSGAIRAISADEPVTVMGNGLGAFVALGMAVAGEIALDKLVLVGCGPAFPESAKPAFSAMIDGVEAGGMAAVTSTALRRIFTDEYLADHPDEAEQRSRVLANTDPKSFVTACRALQQVDFTDRLGDVGIPTLIVVGEDDEATPPEMARALHDSLPDSKLVILPGAAHAPQIQEPAAFVNAIRDFLEEA